MLPVSTAVTSSNQDDFQGIIPRHLAYLNSKIIILILQVHCKMQCGTSYVWPDFASMEHRNHLNLCAVRPDNIVP